MIRCINCDVMNTSTAEWCTSCGYHLQPGSSTDNRHHWQTHSCLRCRGTGCEACIGGNVITNGNPKKCLACEGTGYGLYGTPPLCQTCRGTGYANGYKQKY
jgi:hypothetical protein